MRLLWAVLAATPCLAVVAQLPLLLAVGEPTSGGRAPFPADEFVIGMLAFAIALVVICAFWIRIGRDEGLVEPERSRWRAAAVFLSVLALPLFWWRRIR